MRHHWLIASTALVAPALFFSGTAIAQTQSQSPVPNPSTPTVATPPAGQAGEQATELGEIIVTAQRRTENLQNVPVAVTALSAQQIATTGASDALDLRLAVPSLNITNSNGVTSTSLRGLGSNAFAPGFENPVAVYVDGVYYASQLSGFVDFSTAAQVEVLKGPQGTLFGRNATAGLIQVTTRDPGDKFVFEANAGYANYNTVSGNIYVGGPLAPTLSADLAVKGLHQGDGWGTNLVSGADEYRTDRDIAARSKWVFRPGASTKFTLIGDYSNSKNSQNPVTLFPNSFSGYPVAPGTPAIGKAPDRGYDTATDTPNFKRGYAWGTSLKWEQELGSVNLATTTAFRKSRFTVQFDYDGANQVPGAAIRYVQPERQFSQELQLSSRSNQRFTWVLGAFYFDATAGYEPFFLNANDQGINLTVTDKQSTRSIAGYAQATYEIFDQTHLTLGGRYTTERRRAFDSTVSVFVIPIATALPVATPPDQRVTFNKFTFRASLDHRFSSELLAYASFNRGFKSGGFNTGSPGAPSYRPETVDAYEAGVKTDLLDRRLRVNVAGFYYDYSDVQSQFLQGGAIQIANAARARLYGADVDFEALLTPSLRLSGGFSAISARYRSYPNAVIGTFAGGVPTTIGSAAGNQLPLASKLTVNAALDHTSHLSNGQAIELGANVYYNDGFFTEADNVIRQRHFAQLGAHARWTSADERFSVSAFGKNLTNRKVIAFESTEPNGTHVGEFAAPRTYGVSVGVKF